MPHPLRVGLKLAPQIYPIATHRGVWKIADDAGFDGLCASTICLRLPRMRSLG